MRRLLSTTKAIGQTLLLIVAFSLVPLLYKGLAGSRAMTVVLVFVGLSLLAVDVVGEIMVDRARKAATGALGRRRATPLDQPVTAPCPSTIYWSSEKAPA